MVDPFEEHGVWLVRTESWARHIIDSRDQGGRVTVTRLAANDVMPAAGFELATLRRDGLEIRLFGVAHATSEGGASGIVVGSDMVLTLEPLDPSASVTIRHTTPVVTIERVPDVPASLGTADGQ